MTNPVYRGTSQATNVATGNPPATISGQAVGDILIGVAFGNSGAFTTPTGWTDFAGGAAQDGNTTIYQYFGWRKADGTGSDAFNPSYAGSGVAMYVFSFSGEDTTTPIDGTPTITQWSGSSATVFPPNSTPSTDDDIHVVIYGEGSGPLGVTTPPSGYTDAFATNVAGGARAAAYYKALTGQSGVAQGPTNMVWSGSGYGPAVSLLIKAAGGGGFCLEESEWHPTEPQTNPLTVSVWG